MTLRTTLAALCVLSTSVAGQTPVKVIEDGKLDRIELFTEKIPAPGDLSAGVGSFTVDAANLGTGGADGDEEEQQEAKQLQGECPGLFGTALAAELKSQGGFKATRSDADGAGLIVSGRFTELDPGSRAKRYLVGFGAGKAAVAVEGEVRDASGTVLATFTQRRIASMGMFGGDSVKKMRQDCESIGKDVAKFLSAWAKGQKLD